MSPFRSTTHRLQGYMVTILFVTISVLLLTNIFLIYENSKVIERNKEHQEEAEMIKVNTLDIIKTIHQVDMGIRGYALINSDPQLRVTLDGFVQMDSIFARLEKSLSRQEFPGEYMQVMKDSAHIYFQVIREMLKLVDDGKLEEFKSLLREDIGLNAFRTYATFSKRVNTFENKISSEAKDRYNRALKNSYLLQIVLFFITVPALLYMMRLYNRTIIMSEDLRLAEQQNGLILAAQNQELERQVKLRTNEVVAQNEAIVNRNEQLVLQQDEIARQRNALQEKNKKLEDAYRVIEEQHHLIKARNEELTEAVRQQIQDLQKTNHELIEHNGRLEQFAYIISHNLRAPMARLIGLSTILKEARDEDERNKIVNLMLVSTADFDSVIKDLSSILSIQKSQAEVYSLISLEDIMEKVLTMLESEIKSTEADLQIDFSNAPTLFSLPQYIESIFYNLISNSIKYRHFDRCPKILIKSKALDDTIHISVQDNGLGIDLDRYKGSVFNLYKRFHFHVEGKGLGLYLIRTQVEALGGRINVESELDVGSKFNIEFSRDGEGSSTDFRMYS